MTHDVETYVDLLLLSYGGGYDVFINPSKAEKLASMRKHKKIKILEKYFFVEEMIKNPKNIELLYDLLWQSGSDPCSTIIKYCKINGNVKNCNNIFQILPTSNGPCCTFNINSKHMYRKSPFGKVNNIL